MRKRAVHLVAYSRCPVSQKPRRVPGVPRGVRRISGRPGPSRSATPPRPTSLPATSAASFVPSPAARQRGVPLHRATTRRHYQQLNGGFSWCSVVRTGVQSKTTVRTCGVGARRRAAKCTERARTWRTRFKGVPPACRRKPPRFCSPRPARNLHTLCCARRRQVFDGAHLNGSAALIDCVSREGIGGGGCSAWFVLSSGYPCIADARENVTPRIRENRTHGSGERETQTKAARCGTSPAAGRSS